MKYGDDTWVIVYTIIELTACLAVLFRLFLMISYNKPATNAAQNVTPPIVIQKMTLYSWKVCVKHKLSTSSTKSVVKTVVT